VDEGERTEVDTRGEAIVDIVEVELVVSTVGSARGFRVLVELELRGPCRQAIEG
jgi:hypothetical protein